VVKRARDPLESVDRANQRQGSQIDGPAQAEGAEIKRTKRLPEARSSLWYSDLAQVFFFNQLNRHRSGLASLVDRSDRVERAGAISQALGRWAGPG
jgi:hypothetical protein